jgi:cytochrome P450
LFNLACWTLFYLGANNEWKNKVIAEVRNLISNYSDASSSEQIHERFSSIPVSAWEDETPAIEGVIRETMRLIKTGPALRRNLADNLQFADKTVDKGAYVVYNMADVHLDEMVYSEPLKFDPSRFSPPREEDKQGHMLFLGWGAGRHICSGTIFTAVVYFPTTSSQG